MPNLDYSRIYTFANKQAASQFIKEEIKAVSGVEVLSTSRGLLLKGYPKVPLIASVNNEVVLTRAGISLIMTKFSREVSEIQFGVFSSEGDYVIFTNERGERKTFDSDKLYDQYEMSDILGKNVSVTFKNDGSIVGITILSDEEQDYELLFDEIEGHLFFNPKEQCWYVTSQGVIYPIHTKIVSTFLSDVDRLNDAAALSQFWEKVIVRIEDGHVTDITKWPSKE